MHVVQRPEKSAQEPFRNDQMGHLSAFIESQACITAHSTRTSSNAKRWASQWEHLRTKVFDQDASARTMTLVQGWAPLKGSRNTGAIKAFLLHPFIVLVASCCKAQRQPGQWNFPTTKETKRIAHGWACGKDQHLIFNSNIANSKRRRNMTESDGTQCIWKANATGGWAGRKSWMNLNDKRRINMDHWQSLNALKGLGIPQILPKTLEALWRFNITTNHNHMGQMGLWVTNDFSINALMKVETRLFCFEASVGWGKNSLWPTRWGRSSGCKTLYQSQLVGCTSVVCHSLEQEW